MQAEVPFERVVCLEESKNKPLGPVPERPISANPGLKFCSAFVFYLPMHCLE